MITLGFYKNLPNHPTSILFSPSLSTLSKSGSGALIITPFDPESLERFIEYRDFLGVIAYNIEEFILIAKCGVRYAILSKELAPSCQKIAENYLYDTKVIAMCETSSEMEWAANEGIDGIINHQTLL